MSKKHLAYIWGATGLVVLVVFVLVHWLVLAPIMNNKEANNQEISSKIRPVDKQIAEFRSKIKDIYLQVDFQTASKTLDSRIRVNQEIVTQLLDTLAEENAFSLDTVQVIAAPEQHVWMVQVSNVSKTEMQNIVSDLEASPYVLLINNIRPATRQSGAYQMDLYLVNLSTYHDGIEFDE